MSANDWRRTSHFPSSEDSKKKRQIELTLSHLSSDVDDFLSAKRVIETSYSHKSKWFIWMKNSLLVN